MRRNLTASEMTQLIAKVFAPDSDDKEILIIVDVPNTRIGDNDDWRERRLLAGEWRDILETVKSDLELNRIVLFYYENVGSNNADLPALGYIWDGDPKKASADLLRSQSQSIVMENALAQAQIILAPTEFSTTAPLKVLAKKYPFRAATMPDFSRAMIPALSVDYDQVHERVMRIKTRLDDAAAARIHFEVGGKEYRLFMDLRFRSAHASSGLLRERGVAGNLPSGEAYIVPYEGEGPEKSQSAGELPVQFGDEIVVYEIRENRAIAVLTKGIASDDETSKLAAEPAYGNIAELGFGVLAAFGIQPMGETLLDEKLGFHIAFGRSDHFGGAVSPKSFRDPSKVVHIDRIYIPEVQSRVLVREVRFEYPSGRDELILADGKYASL